MSDGWRPIHEFPGYMIQSDGEVRNYRTGKLIVPVTTNHRMYVRLYKKGAVYNRSIRKLLDRAFPEIDPHDVIDAWQPIPGFEAYEINRYHDIRKISTKRLLRVYTDSGVYVVFSRDGRPHKRSIQGIVRSIYGE